MAVVAAMARAGTSPSEATYAVHGYGTAGRGAAHELNERSAKLVAASTASGAVRNSDGLGVGALNAHLDHGGRIAGFGGGIAVDPRAVLRERVDVLVLAAYPAVLDEDDARAVEAGIVCEVGNAQVTPAAEEILLRRGKIVLPDLPSGGVGTWASGRELRGYDPATIWSELERKSLRVNSDVFAFAEAHGLPARTAAWTLALRPYVEHGRETGVI
jgi:glutamate dehydrogenase/leucine dehydrogenase